MTPPNRNVLNDIEGLPVVQSTIAITNAGDGLSQAMKVEPTAFHTGDTHYVVLECEVAKFAFVPVDSDNPKGPQKRVHTFRAGVATIVDASIVEQLVKDQAAKNLSVAEGEAGIARLPGVDDDPVTARVRMWLSSQTRTVLRGLCEEFGVSFPVKATAPDLIDLLAANADKIKDLVGEDV